MRRIDELRDEVRKLIVAIELQHAELSIRQVDILSDAYIRERKVRVLALIEALGTRNRARGDIEDQMAFHRGELR